MYARHGGQGAPKDSGFVKKRLPTAASLVGRWGGLHICSRFVGAFLLLNKVRHHIFRSITSFGAGGGFNPASNILRSRLFRIVR